MSFGFISYYEIGKIVFGCVALLILFGPQNAVLSQPIDSVRLERAIFMETGVVTTPGSDKYFFGNYIAGAGYQQEIVAVRAKNNVVSILLSCGFGYTYFDLQAGMQLPSRSTFYVYAGIQLMMYYELGSSRDLIYDKSGYLKHPPDRIMPQVLPNFGLGLNLGGMKVELISSQYQPMNKDILLYFVLRACFKI